MREYVNTGGPATIRWHGQSRTLFEGDRVQVADDVSGEQMGIILDPWPDIVPVDSERGREYLVLEAAEEAACRAQDDADRARAVKWLEENDLPDYVYWYLRHG